MKNEITLGEARYWVTGFALADGRKGILLRPIGDEADGIEIGDRHPNWDGKEKSINWETDTIIWCKNIEGARILQDAINIVVLEFGGFKISDA